VRQNKKNRHWFKLKNREPFYNNIHNLKTKELQDISTEMFGIINLFFWNEELESGESFDLESLIDIEIELHKRYEKKDKI